MKIEKIILVHHTHVDYGYTDPQPTALRLNCAYIDAALSAIERSENAAPDARFRWTQEVFLPLKLWWEAASPIQRRKLRSALASGQFELGAMPASITGFASEEEWAYMLDLLPRTLRQTFCPEVLIQNDVNGISRRGMEMAWDRGVRMLWMGPNSYYGMPPASAPFAFYWELAPGKRVLVWCNSSYNDGTFLFNENWRQGPVPAAHDLCYRPPAQGDLFCCDDDSLQRAHARLTQRLALLTGGADHQMGTDGFTKCRTRTDYPYPTLIASVAGQWRCDNDPPFAPLSDFVEKWNAKGYAPRLVLATAGQALRAFEQDCGALKVCKGVWTDYWANGLASAPAEMRCAREARRTLEAACHPMLGKMTQGQEKQRASILYNLMMFGEHTFAAWESAADPYCANSQAQLAEKKIYAYRALEAARMLRAERMRAFVHPSPNSLAVCNTAGQSRVMHLNLATNALRGNDSSLISQDGKVFALHRAPGRGNFLRPDSPQDFSEDNVARTFGDCIPDMRVISDPIEIPPHSCQHFQLSPKTVSGDVSDPLPEVQTDEQGWPVYLRFDQSPLPLIDGMVGAFRSVRAKGIAPRWTFKDIFDTDEEDERLRRAGELLVHTQASYDSAQRRCAQGQLIFTQRFHHPSLRMGRRTLCVDLRTRRATLAVKIDRLSDFAPEIFYIGFRAPCGEDLPMASLTGQPFRPFADNLPGTCRDFFAIDGYLQYGSSQRWSWFARDSALVCIDSPRPCSRMEKTPEDVRSFWAQVLDSTWDTNFDPNPCGRMVFRFDLATDAPEHPLSFFEQLATEQMVMVHAREDNLSDPAQD